MNRSLSISLLCGSQHLGHCCSQSLPGILLNFQLPKPAFCQFVILGPAVILRSSPVRPDPATALQTMKRGVKRSLLDLKHVTRDLPDPLRHSPSVLGPERERSQDKKIKSTLRQVNPLGRHALPFSFYIRPYTGFLSKCKERPPSKTRQSLSGLFWELPSQNPKGLRAATQNGPSPGGRAVLGHPLIRAFDAVKR
jgi:hypothetical protein